MKTDYFIPLNYPDPHGFGDRYRPVFPPRHTTLKAVMDNLPDTIEKVWVFGSSVRWDAGADSDLDLLLVGTIDDESYGKIIGAIPPKKKLDMLVYTQEHIDREIKRGVNIIFEKIVKRGYLFYEKETK